MLFNIQFIDDAEITGASTMESFFIDTYTTHARYIGVVFVLYIVSFWIWMWLVISLLRRNCLIVDVVPFVFAKRTIRCFVTGKSAKLLTVVLCMVWMYVYHDTLHKRTTEHHITYLDTPHIWQLELYISRTHTYAFAHSLHPDIYVYKPNCFFSFFFAGLRSKSNQRCLQQCLQGIRW